jgi:ABC-type multidrug transport system ATPase subunit
MLTRHIIPTSGDAFIANHSILDDFKLGSTHLGVVTQNNSLWDLLSVQDHLKLFARLRGVPEDLVYRVVESTIDQLELTPHRYKLAGRLSGGMKRKVSLLPTLFNHCHSSLELDHSHSHPSSALCRHRSHRRS